MGQCEEHKINNTCIKINPNNDQDKIHFKETSIITTEVLSGLKICIMTYRLVKNRRKYYESNN